VRCACCVPFVLLLRCAAARASMRASMGLPVWAGVFPRFTSKERLKVVVVVKSRPGFQARRGVFWRDAEMPGCLFGGFLAWVPWPASEAGGGGFGRAVARLGASPMVLAGASTLGLDFIPGTLWYPLCHSKREMPL
jgi:hypothetical protein